MNTTNLLKRTYARLGWTKVDGSGDMVVDGTCKFPLARSSEFIQDVLDEFEDALPRRRIFKYPVDSNTPREYGLPANCAHLLDVWWKTDLESGISPEIPDRNVATQYKYSADLLELLLDYNSIDELGHYSRTIGTDYIILDGTVIKLLSQGTIRNFWIYFHSPRLIAEVNDTHLDLFSYKLAVAILDAYLIGTERTSGIQRAGGITERTGGQTLESMRDKYLKQWDDKITRLQKLGVLGVNDGVNI